MKKRKFVKTIALACLLTISGKSGFGQILTYPIVGTEQTISYGNSGIISTPTAGQPFYGQNSNHQGNIPGYKNNGDGTITDRISGLMWEKTTDKNGDGVINYYDKLTYAEALAAASSCRTGGYSDWRLPTIKEQYSLIMYYGAESNPHAATQGTSVPFINTGYFAFGYGDLNASKHGGTTNERLIDAQYATSSVYVSTTMHGTPTMFGVNFADGRIKGYPANNRKKYYVLYVRGNADYGTNKFTDNGNGTITDHATGLMWMQNDNGSAALWENALNYAENFSFAGYSDWRLPDVKELQGIVDYTRSPATTGSAAINSLFNCTQITNEAGVKDYPYYWSNTTFCSKTPTDGKAACYVSFGRAMGYMGNWIDVHGAGAQRSDPKTGDPANFPAGFGPQGDAIRILNYVRLVRSIDKISGLNEEVPVPSGTKDETVYHQVKARTNANSQKWNSYTAKTIDRLPGFTYSNDPEKNGYGSWKVNRSTASGFFRVEQKEHRWWIIDPEGYPFIHKGIAVYRPSGSEGQQSAMKAKYGSAENWVIRESRLLKENGFNGTGAWSDVDLMRQSPDPLVYTVIVNPMGSYKSDHKRKFGGQYEMAGWQGYRYDLVMVFDPEFDAYVEKEIAPIAKYANDKYLLGYFTDNELPWKNDALDRHLQYLGKDEAGYIAAKKWLDERKGKDASPQDVNDADRLAFTGFYFETYIKKVATALRKYDPNHLYLGCRFNQEKEELQNPEIFKVAGKYVDIISINHYRKWEPVQSIMADWANWSGRPFIITEWYTKGEDSGLPNKSGAGWNVPTQAERGYFYQNFTIELLRSKNCVGWHWFTYQDNDPMNLKTDPSNRDSNKGIVNSNYDLYKPLMENMKSLNTHAYELIKYLDKQ